MERQSNCSPCSSNENAVLDVKPLRSLAPMFPAPLGLNTFTQSTAPPFVCVAPVGPFPSGSESGCPSGFSPAFASFATSDAPHRGPVGPVPGAANDGSADVEVPNANGCIRATPLSASFRTPPTNVIPLDDDEPTYSGHTSASGRRIKRPAHLSSYRSVGSDTEGTNGSKVKKARPRKVFDNDLALVPSSLHDTKGSVEMILMTFDALRRRLLQVDEANDINRRADLKAGAILMANNVRANLGKRIGPVPGIKVGDIFYFRMEMCVVGMHAPSMAGIDYMNARFLEQDDTVAISIVSAGGYENEEDDVDVLVYTGQGGSSKNSKNQMDDQKLERGNLALERSKDRKNEIRVIRSAKDYSVQNGKIYIYDGLYKIQKSWIDKSKSGFNVFKYQLLREPGQSDGLSVWKRTQKWKENPASRERVILPDISSGIENIPVCLVNDVDGEKGPGHFSYVTKVKYLRPISSMKRLGGCACLSVCLPGDTNCICAQQNGGYLPYSSTGFLVSRKPVIYECGSSCQCSINCRNRVTQKGIRLHFEVFRTRDRGWGLRSWDPIRAGTFICEYTGEVVEEIRLDDDGEEDEYIFQTTGAGERTFKWNYEPGLLGEPGTNDLSETFEPLPIIISARNMGNISRFMNHSCSPNVFSQPVQHDHADEGYPHIMFFAIKHIPPLTELTYDYGQGEVESGGMGPRRAKKCLCGSPKCRGFFR